MVYVLCGRHDPRHVDADRQCWRAIASVVVVHAAVGRGRLVTRESEAFPRLFAVRALLLFTTIPGKSRLFS